jgi:hypothetical protein
MKTALRIALLFIGGSNAALSLAGCKTSACPDTVGADGGVETHPNCVQLQPTIEYDDMTPRTGAVAWTPGEAVSITSKNGDVTVSSDSTAADQVQISGIGFTRDTSDATGKQNATDHLTAMASPDITTDASGVVVNAPGGGFDGYKLTVHLPVAFNGAFKISQSNGDVTLSATPTGAGSFIHTDVGDINANIGMANVKVTAKSEFGGTVMFPATWTVQMLDDAGMTSGTATVGDGSGTLDVLTKNGSIFLN